MPLSLEELEQQARERIGLFAKAEPPPRQPTSTTEQLGREFLTQAAPIFGFMGAPNALGLAGVRVPPLTARLSAPLSPAGASRYIEPPPMGQSRLTPADYNAARAQLPPDASLADRTAAATRIAQERSQTPLGYTQGHQPTGIDRPRIGYDEALRRLNAALGDHDVGAPLSSPSFLRGLTDEQRRIVQGHVDNGMAEFQLRAAVREMQIGNKRAMGGQPSQRQFDINNFREPQQPATPASPGPGYGEQGNFMAPTIPGGFKPPSLTDRLAQVPNPARRELPSEMPIGEVTQGSNSWKIPYTPGGQERGAIYGHPDPNTGRINVSSSSLPSSAQGQGYGIEMYDRFARAVHKAGKVMGSDAILSDKSYPIYGALANRGYNVTRSPDYQRTRGQYPNQTYSGDSVFTVGPKELLPAPSLMDMLMRVPKTSPYAMVPVAPLGAAFFQQGDEQ